MTATLPKILCYESAYGPIVVVSAYGGRDIRTEEELVTYIEREAVANRHIATIDVSPFSFAELEERVHRPKAPSFYERRILPILRLLGLK